MIDATIDASDLQLIFEEVETFCKDLSAKIHLFAKIQ